MISPDFITEWSQQCPWTSPAQVEQDLVLSRGLVEVLHHCINIHHVGLLPRYYLMTRIAENSRPQDLSLLARGFHVGMLSMNLPN